MKIPFVLGLSTFFNIVIYNFFSDFFANINQIINTRRDTILYWDSFSSSEFVCASQDLSLKQL